MDWRIAGRKLVVEISGKGGRDSMRRQAASRRRIAPVFMELHFIAEARSD
jgi:hypothetical protein